MRRRLKLLRRRLARDLRAHYMLGVSAVALGLAAAAGLGAFDGERPRTDRSAEGRMETPTPVSTVDPAMFTPVAPQVMTLFLVDSEAARNLLTDSKDRAWNREFLGTQWFDVLLIPDGGGRDAVSKAVESVRQRAPQRQYVVVDLRAY